MEEDRTHATENYSKNAQKRRRCTEYAVAPFALATWRRREPQMGGAQANRAHVLPHRERGMYTKKPWIHKRPGPSMYTKKPSKSTGRESESAGKTKGRQDRKRAAKHMNMPQEDKEETGMGAATETTPAARTTTMKARLEQQEHHTQWYR